MKISTAKIEILHLLKNPDQCVLQVNGATLKQVEKFKYLGVAFTCDGRQDEELDTRIGKASAVMRTLHYSFVMKRELSKKAKLSIFKEVLVRIRDVEAVKFLMLPLPAPIEGLCFRVCFRFLTFGIFCFRFQVRIELVASEFVSASSLH